MADIVAVALTIPQARVIRDALAVYSTLAQAQGEPAEAALAARARERIGRTMDRLTTSDHPPPEDPPPLLPA